MIDVFPDEVTMTNGFGPNTMAEKNKRMVPGGGISVLVRLPTLLTKILNTLLHISLHVVFE